ncbi:MAG TPA: hypothetical protein VIH42_07510, partial [Thermoguttaceae bacterium]
RLLNPHPKKARRSKPSHKQPSVAIKSRAGPCRSGGLAVQPGPHGSTDFDELSRIELAEVGPALKDAP